eukprot:gene15251-biopygen6655
MSKRTVQHPASCAPPPPRGCTTHRSISQAGLPLRLAGPERTRRFRTRFAQRSCGKPGCRKARGPALSNSNVLEQTWHTTDGDWPAPAKPRPPGVPGEPRGSDCDDAPAAPLCLGAPPARTPRSFFASHVPSGSKVHTIPRACAIRKPRGASGSLSLHSKTSL